MLLSLSRTHQQGGGVLSLSFEPEPWEKVKHPSEAACGITLTVIHCLCCWTSSIILASALFTWMEALLSQHKVLGIIKVLLTMLLWAGAGTKKNIYSVVWACPLSHAPDFLPSLHENYSWCVKLSVNFSSPDSPLKQSQRVCGLIRMHFGISIASPQNFWLYFLCLCMIIFHCFFFFSPQWQHVWLQHEREWKSNKPNQPPEVICIGWGDLFFRRSLVL